MTYMQLDNYPVGILFTSLCVAFSSVQSFSRVQLFLDLAQTHVHRVGDTIQQSHPSLPPSLPAFNLSQHWGLFD